MCIFCLIAKQISTILRMMLQTVEKLYFVILKAGVLRQQFGKLLLAKVCKMWKHFAVKWKSAKDFYNYFKRFEESCDLMELLDLSTPLRMTIADFVSNLHSSLTEGGVLYF